VRASINARTSVTGYSATPDPLSATVTVVAPINTPNGTAVTVNQSGITVNPATLALGGGIPGTPAAMSLKIAALGDKQVLNHAYSGPNATTFPYNKKFITRHYGFGSIQGTVELVAPNGTTRAALSVDAGAWSDGLITATVPSNLSSAFNCTLQQRGQPTTKCGQLEITSAAGIKSIDTVTVTIDGKAPIVVTPTAVTYPDGYSPVDTDAAFGRLEASPLQSAIDNAVAGDLIIVTPGTYRDNLLMWKPLRLQGVGAESVTINADAHPAGKLDAWRREVNCLFGLSLDGRPLLADGAYAASEYDPSHTYTCPTHMQQRVDRIPFETVLGWDTTGNGNLAQMIQEPTLMGAYEGAGVTALGRGIFIPANSNDFWGSTTAGGFPAGYQYVTGSNAYCNSTSTTRIDGRDYGTSNYHCNPARIDGLSVINSSQGGGAIWAHAWSHNVEVSNNRVRSNHGTLTGGITISNGEFPDPFIVNGENAPPPGHPEANSNVDGLQVGYAFVVNARVHHNMVTANASIGDSLYSGTPSAAGGISFCSGSDGYLLDHNWVCGNLSYGDAAGVAHVGFINNGQIRNNTILFNQSQQATLPVNGGGLGVLGASPDRTLADGTECGSTNDADCPPGLPEGTGRNLVIDANLIMGNSAESGSGGGVRLQMINGQDVAAFPTDSSRWNSVTMTNNIIANNVAGWDGGGVSLQDALKVRMINNTIINNDTTASAGVLFKTIGAPLAAVPPPNCNPGTSPGATCPGAINNLSTNQPAGVVTMSHTPNLVAAIGTTTLSCPSGYGYYNSNGATLNTSCRSVSLPLLMNNVLWHNRAFHVEVGDLGTGQQNQQKVVTLVPSLNQTLTGMCASLGTNNGAPGSGAPVNYWDIGVRGDTVPTAAGNTGSFRLQPRNSILSSGGYSGAAPFNNLGADPAVIAEYCNGSRLPPEGGGVFAGFNAPAGRAETTGLYPVFALNQAIAAPTVDEGNNWVNLNFGPFSLSNASTYSAAGTVLAPVGDYGISAGSPAINNGAGSAVGVSAPTSDFYGRGRTGAPDIGAVEYAQASTAAASVSPGTLDFGLRVAGSGTTSAQLLTLHNNSSVALTTVQIAVAPSGVYTRSGGTCGTTLTANSSCTIGVTFTTSSASDSGIKTGTVSITTANAAVANSPVSLTADVGTTPSVAATPSPLVFGTGASPAPIGVTTVRTLTLTNTGSLPVTGFSVSLSSAATSAGFALVNNGCGNAINGASSSAPGTCTVDIALTPTATATNVTMSGAVTFGAANATIAPVSLNRTTARIADLAITMSDDVTSVAQGGTVTYTIVVTNNGPSPVTGAVVTDNRAATYLSAWSWSCTPVALCGGSTGSNTNQSGNINKTVATLASGDAVTFVVTGQVSYTATTGTNTAGVSVGGSGATDPNLANNSASDTNAIIVPSVKFTAASGSGTLTANTLGFGAVAGSTPRTSTLTLSITGTVTFAAPTVTNTAGAGYALGGTNTCTGTRTGGTCQISVTFNPSGNNTKTGTLSVPFTGGQGSPAILNMTGS
jgi:hypothetical protein